MITKNDKLKILSLALDILKGDYKTGFSVIRMVEIRFMCIAIESAASELGLRNDKTAVQLIPELLKYKPANKEPWEMWFPTEELEKRINIIKEIINDLK